MSKPEKSPKVAEASNQGFGAWQMINVIGLIIGIAGFIVMVRAGKDLSGASDQAWYGGLAATIIGGCVWFFVGMPRAEIIEWLRNLAIAAGIALCIRWSMGEPYRIPSGSMEPTFHGDPGFGKGDRVFVNKWVYGLRYPFTNKRIWQGRLPERWDIVVFKSVEPNALHGTLVKRVVGLPGEHIQIREGKVFVNDSPLTLPESMPRIEYSAPYGARYGIDPEKEYSVVPEGHYLVMGDNTDNSRDGRYFGWLPNENIVGRVSCIAFPPWRCRDFTGFSKTLWWRTLVGILGVLALCRLVVGRSWLTPSLEARGVRHFYVSFLAYGLRIPFTRYWLSFWGQPRRGEWVLYHAPAGSASAGHLFLGRVAGLPGEQVAIDEAGLAINGETQPGFEKDSFPALEKEAEYALPKKKNRNEVPAGHVFLLSGPIGPQEDPSDITDSRVFGWVPQEHIIGRALAVWWPPHRWKRL